MTRIGLLAVFLLPVLILTAGCGGGDGADDGQASRDAISEQTTPSAEPAATEGRPAIPPAMPDAVESLKIAPYFDEQGTQSERSVAAGEVFNVYICVEHPGFDMKTAQWRLNIPEGIDVLGETKAFDQALSIGSYKDIFVMTYPCQGGGEAIYILRYSCMVTPEFTGGTLETVKAEPAHGHGAEPPFIGFVTCGDQPEQVPSYGGSATLTLK